MALRGASGAGWASALTGAQAEKLGRLLELVRSNGVVRPCLSRVASYVVPRHVGIRERAGSGPSGGAAAGAAGSGPSGAPAAGGGGFCALAEELDAFLGAHFARFLAGALEMMYACGFVVFVVRRRELRGKVVPVPVLLPLGAFTWRVQAAGRGASGAPAGAGGGRKRRGGEEGLFYYEVTPTHPGVRAEELWVYSAADAAPAAEAMPSPLDGLLAEWGHVQAFDALARRTDEWNATKHVTTSEKVDAPRDQTTDGISLLDDFRRYIMSGQHTGISSNYMMMSGPEGAAARDDPSNAANSWIEDFSFGAAKGVATCVHLMPPNTTVGELGALELKHDREQVHARFEKRVLAFFELTEIAGLGGQHTAALACENELRGMRRVSALCATMLEHVYAATFEVEAADVRVALPRPAPPAVFAAEAAKAAEPAKAAKKAKAAK
jgi:hypothetical protein